jgi:hypothetical protein
MKTDYKKARKELYAPRAGVPGILRVPRMNFLMLSGKGRPEDESFRQGVQTLFPAAYVMKFLWKARRPAEDFTVMPLEVKWRLDRSRSGSERFRWTMMVMQPDAVGAGLLQEALQLLARKKKHVPFAPRLRVQTFAEGLCGQMLYIGPYGKPMDAAFGRVKRKILESGYQPEPDSHDIYFNDIRRTAPEKLRTLMRVRIWEADTPQPIWEDPWASEEGGS